MDITKDMHSKMARPREVAQVLCAMLGEAAVNPSGTLRDAFGPYGAGVQRERLYAWIENEFPHFSVGAEHERDKSADQFELSDVLTAFCLAYVTTEARRPFDRTPDPRVYYRVWLDAARNAQANLEAENGVYEALSFHYDVQFSVKGREPLNIPCSKGYGLGSKTRIAARRHWQGHYNVDVDKSLARLMVHGGVPWEIAQAHGRDHVALKPTPMEALWWAAQDGFAAHGQSFAQWASELGYSDDSIKAKGVYDMCAAQYDGLVRVFGHARLAQLERFWNSAENDI